jgi:hypothetical protein
VTISIQIVTNTCISESEMDGAVTSPMYMAAQYRLPSIAIILARSKIFQCNCLVVKQLWLLGLESGYVL